MSYKKSTFKSLFIFIIISTFLFLFPFCNKWFSSNTSFNRTVLAIIAPFQECVHSLVYAFKNYIFLISTAKENKLLKREIILRRMLDNKYLQTDLVNSSLRNLLAFKKKIIQNTVAAEIISWDMSQVSSIITINKGSSDGLMVGAPVVAPEGIVGSIVRVIENYSQVMLITDPRSSIDAFVGNNIKRVLVEGCGNDCCSLEYLTEKCDINVGNIVVSSGLDKIFPENVNIGSVSRIIPSNFNKDLSIKFIVKPFVNFNTLKNVIIIISDHSYLDDFRD